jgi:ribulose-5-phosphate 4-epimerase/fuculose-1-phosphate aldolase
VTDALREHDLVQMVNHGQTTVATDVAHAIQNASFFEMACAILLRGGERIAPLTAEQAGALLALKAARNSAV